MPVLHSTSLHRAAGRSLPCGALMLQLIVDAPTAASEAKQHSRSSVSPSFTEVMLRSRELSAGLLRRSARVFSGVVKACDLEAAGRIAAAEPVLEDVIRAGEIPGMTHNTILCSGPRMAWDQ